MINSCLAARKSDLPQLKLARFKGRNIVKISGVEVDGTLPFEAGSRNCREGGLARRDFHAGAKLVARLNGLFNGAMWMATPVCFQPINTKSLPVFGIGARLDVTRDCILKRRHRSPRWWHQEDRPRVQPVVVARKASQCVQSVAFGQKVLAGLSRQSRKLIEENRHTGDELTPFSPEELQEVATAFAERCKASAKNFTLPAPFDDSVLITKTFKLEVNITHW
jgi:hypothetical protein